MSPTVSQVLRELKRRATRATLNGMARYGIPSDRAFGVPVGAVNAYGRQIGRNHALAQALWASGWFEARMLVATVADPDQLTRREMDAWVREFDNWAICDHLCFHLFDRTPFAWTKARQWAKGRPEFTRRAGFALMWALALHDKAARDAEFLACIPLLERGATDERHYVRKAVDMALRAFRRRGTAVRNAARRVTGA